MQKIHRMLAAGALSVAGVLTVMNVAGAQEAPTTETPPAEAPAAEAERPGKRAWAADALAPLVAEGTINQAQADAVIDALDAARPGKGGGHHRGRPGLRRLGHLEPAATALGMSVDDLRGALDGDTSLADVARERNVDPQVVTDALVAALRTHLAEHVAEGRHTQAQADRLLAEATSRIAAFVNGEAPGPGGRGFGGRGPGGHGRGFRMAPSEGTAGSSSDGAAA